MRKNPYTDWQARGVAIVAIVLLIIIILLASFADSALGEVRHVDSPLVSALEERDQTCDDLLSRHNFPDRISRWCPLVNHYFGDADTHWALHIIECESRGDPKAKNRRSSARGLFQHLTSKYFYPRARKAGVDNPDPFDPEDNTEVAAWLFDNGGPWHWRACHRRFLRNH